MCRVVNLQCACHSASWFNGQPTKRQVVRFIRSKDLESSCDAAALQGVGLQAVVTEYLITYAELIFSDKLPHYNGENLLSEC